MIDFLDGVHFAHPVWFWTWLPALLVLGRLLKANRLRALTRETGIPGTPSYRHPRLALLRRAHGETPARPTTGLELGPWLQYAVILLCFCAAMAQPYRPGRLLPTPPCYHDMYFLIGSSLNMSLRDYRVNGKPVSRMFVMKRVLREFIDHLQKDHTTRIGLIAFSEQPFTLVPLTADHNLLKNAVGLLQPAVLTGRTTNLGKALLYTLQQLQERKPAANASKPVLVLFTGVNWTYRNIDPRAIAAYLHSQGYRLYTVAIGSAGNGERSHTHTALIYEPANFALMKSIAARGGGRFYWADTGNSLKAAIRAIQAAQRNPANPINNESSHVATPLYQWPLLAGLAWLALMQLLPVLARRR